MERKTIKQFITFAFVGGVATGIDFLVFNIIFFMNEGFLFSRISGIFCSMFWNFLANRHITFKAKGDPRKQLFKYLIIYGISMSVNVFVSWTMFQILGPGQFNANIAAVTGLAVSIPIAFIGLKLWVFKK
jgi:putative flippase GtrA